MNQLRLKDIPRMIDVSAVRTDVTVEEVLTMVEIAKKHKFICAFTMPCYTELLIRELQNTEYVSIGGVVGFPSGADTTEVKKAATRELIDFGCDELDMVINVGAMKSDQYDCVFKDIRDIVIAAKDIPVKAILEISYLTDEQITAASIIAADAGAAFIKTGTGWGNKPTTTATIEIIKKAIGDRALIKAAGGVRTLSDMESMAAAGCNRFGISVSSALHILKEAYDREGLSFPGPYPGINELERSMQ